ncbi:uncharacterized protein SPAPADRAFT_66081 [Spathaspora passalidarum NRRL Y-27907]|uniref:CBM21 domain-containing protein n=1 Tax=Spathaspora passalidarum (strain NRRL Y-27907 / 11-Y1) TaxID=619300 RepID=G3AL31_SPAPN|nr:uncharacterized protein SPAPADRAFT_66081 [Spathaspora passalidarum NRRL Y-27907]EGW33074.1 hypothetical protein SPAPADRAFT_66081 [Spathaspora passalidarum NRRL Y-27907]
MSTKFASILTRYIRSESPTIIESSRTITSPRSNDFLKSCQEAQVALNQYPKSSEQNALRSQTPLAQVDTTGLQRFRKYASSSSLEPVPLERDSRFWKQPRESVVQKQTTGWKRDPSRSKKEVRFANDTHVHYFKKKDKPNMLCLPNSNTCSYPLSDHSIYGNMYILEEKIEPNYRNIQLCRKYMTQYPSKSLQQVSFQLELVNIPPFEYSYDSDAEFTLVKLSISPDKQELVGQVSANGISFDCLIIRYSVNNWATVSVMSSEQVEITDDIFSFKIPLDQLFEDGEGTASDIRINYYSCSGEYDEVNDSKMYDINLVKTSKMTDPWEEKENLVGSESSNYEIITNQQLVYLPEYYESNRNVHRCSFDNKLETVVELLEEVSLFESTSVVRVSS